MKMDNKITITEATVILGCSRQWFYKKYTKLLKRKVTTVGIRYSENEVRTLKAMEIEVNE